MNLSGLSAIAPGYQQGQLNMADLQQKAQQIQVFLGKLVQVVEDQPAARHGGAQDAHDRQKEFQPVAAGSTPSEMDPADDVAI